MRYSPCWSWLSPARRLLAHRGRWFGFRDSKGPDGFENFLTRFGGDDAQGVGRFVVRLTLRRDLGLDPSQIEPAEAAWQYPYDPETFMFDPESGLMFGLGK